MRFTRNILSLYILLSDIIFPLFPIVSIWEDFFLSLWKCESLCFLHDVMLWYLILRYRYKSGIANKRYCLILKTAMALGWIIPGVYTLIFFLVSHVSFSSSTWSLTLLLILLKS
jgi:hypothetical protein